MLRSFFLFALLLSLFSCSDSEHDGFERTESGLHWKLLAFDERVKQAQIGDYTELSLAYRNMKDSVLMLSTVNVRGGKLLYRLDSLEIKGGVREGLKILFEGDSAAFIVDAKQFFSQFLEQEVPKSMTGETNIRIDVKVNTVWTTSEYQAKEAAKKETLLKLEMEEQQVLKKIIQKYGLDSTHYHRGVWMETLTESTGETPQSGDFIQIRFKGFFPDGQLFESERSEGTTMDFVFGKPEIVIKGLEIAIKKLAVGQKTRIIIPSQLAFGERGVPGIVPPFTTLIYELELLNITRS